MNTLINREIIDKIKEQHCSVCNREPPLILYNGDTVSAFNDKDLEKFSINDLDSSRYFCPACFMICLKDDKEIPANDLKLNITLENIFEVKENTCKCGSKNMLSLVYRENNIKRFIDEDNFKFFTIDKINNNSELLCFECSGLQKELSMWRRLN
jgi:hypothetical protein